MLGESRKVTGGFQRQVTDREGKQRRIGRGCRALAVSTVSIAGVRNGGGREHILTVDD